MRRLAANAGPESYLAADAEAGLLDIHLMGENEITREVVQVLASLAHPNLTRLRDAGVVDSQTYLVEDHIEGIALADLVADRPLPGDVALHLIAALSSALAEADEMAHEIAQLVVRVPRLSEIFVSSVGQIKVGLTAVIGLHSAVETLINVEEAEVAAAAAQAAGRQVVRRSRPAPSLLAGIGALVEQALEPVSPDDGPAEMAARDLAQSAQRGFGPPADCHMLHRLAVAALQKTLTSPTGGFVSGKLSDLVEHLSPRCGADEAELSAAGAQLVAALPDGTPAAGRVQSFFDLGPGGLPWSGPRGGHLPRHHVMPIGAHALGQNLQGTPYKLLRKLGVGGMGIVFEADHVDLNRRVAIKVLHGALNRDPQVLARFKQEARSAARIRHPHIVEIYDFGTTSAGEVFLVMELLDGQNLTRLCRGGRMPLWRSVEILRQVCEGVEAAHQAGVIHRDLKPDNIMVLSRKRPTQPGQQDWAKVLDFGIAKLRERGGLDGQAITRQGQLFGTPEYMAPEQILGGATDHRVDIYSLGCIAYEVLTGELPFTGDGYGKMLAAHLKEPPLPLTERQQGAGIPPRLNDVVLRAMAKDPEGRYATMEEFGLALGEVLVGLLPETLADPLVGPLAGATPSSGSGAVVRAVEPGRSAPVVAVAAGSARSAPSSRSASRSARSARSTTSRPPLDRGRPLLRPVLWGGVGALIGLCGFLVWIAQQPGRIGTRDRARSRAGDGEGSASQAKAGSGPGLPAPPTQNPGGPPSSAAQGDPPDSAQRGENQQQAALEPLPPIIVTGVTPPALRQTSNGDLWPPLRGPVPQTVRRIPALDSRNADPPTRQAAPPPSAPAATQAAEPIALAALQPRPATTGPTELPSGPGGPESPAAGFGDTRATRPHPAAPATDRPKSASSGDGTTGGNPADKPSASALSHPSAQASPPGPGASSYAPVPPTVRLAPAPAERFSSSASSSASPQSADRSSASSSPLSSSSASSSASPAFTGGRLSYTVQSTTSAYGRRDAASGLESTRRALDACYQQAVRRSPGDPPRGAGTFMFAISEDGRLLPGQSLAAGAAAPLRACLEESLLQARFPRPEIGPALVTLHLDLLPIP